MYQVPMLCRNFAVRSPHITCTNAHRFIQCTVPAVSFSLYHTTPSHSSFGHSIQPSNIVESPLPQIERSSLDLYHYVHQNFHVYGSKIAVVDGTSGQEYSFNQIDELTSKFSSGLNRMGFREGDVLSIVSPNSPASPVLFFGTIASCGIISPCNPTFTADELAFQFKNSNARFVATIPPLLPIIQEAIKETNVEKIIVIDDPGESQMIRPSNELLSYQALISDSGSRFNPRHANLQNIAVLPYSSGTTGFPKGVMLTHNNITSNMLQVFHPEIFDLTKEGTCLLGLMPFFHIYGMAVIMASSLRFGSKLVTLPKFEPETFLKTLQDHRVNFAHLVPPLILFLAKHPLVDQYDLSSIREIMTSAAPVGLDMIEAVTERIGCKLIRQGYGLTETSGVTHFMPRSLEMTKPDAVGVVSRSMSCKVVNPETGAVLGAGEEGELWLTGPNIMKGYLNRPEATAECITEDGWFKTGDVGYYDTDGCFYITDRLKELIKVKGLQVAPAELEAVLVTHPKIADAAVIGVPDERQGESPKAFVVKKEEGITEKEVAEFIASKLAVHKHLTGGVEFIDVIPKSASGKILRRILKKPK